MSLVVRPDRPPSMPDCRNRTGGAPRRRRERGIVEHGPRCLTVATRRPPWKHAITPSLWFRRECQGSGGVLRVGVSQQQNTFCPVLSRKQGRGTSGLSTRYGRQRARAGVRAGWPAFLGNQRRSTIQVQRGETSFTISCEGQDDINYYWERLSNVPEAQQCGWCKDRFGLSWQVVPRNMGELDTKRPNAYAHMMQMKKLVVADF